MDLIDSGGGKVDFQVNNETYFLNIGDNDGGWEVMVSTPSGPRQVPVYRDTRHARPLIVLEQEGDRLPN
jgi:hypothetical protein